ncbi:MAG: helix-turn-helix transcriptional regulator [Alphaproteobacteria bacterium]|nr:helix-turn-helix transcriptional regulator [Alphaproteobacteria bacterium]MBT4018328.1 helix-turn-helix transcriptional regulator [Alphaproteobacteria bacterium]MBT4966830.1 helix-turn-helix transcriptional regulator [Alphaproteobacteria bacterium]MBT5160702.1 helix-turn-helix transcriptional regulator [Alphaproteobacteria bacterium]
MTQGKLGDAVKLTFQQIQKYERGANRIGSSRLYQFSQILDVPVSFFFDDMPGDLVTGAIIDPESNPALSEENQFARRETLELVRAYYAIESPAVRKRVFELVKVVAGLSAEEVIAEE